MTTFHQPPYQADGLYDPRYEHDACGVAHGRAPRQPADARGRRQGAHGAGEPRAPWRRRAPTPSPATAPGSSRRCPTRSCAGWSTSSFLRPAPTASRCASCRRDPAVRAKIEALLELNVRVEGQEVLGWRDVPIDEEHVGSTANSDAPVHAAALRAAPRTSASTDQDAFERKLYVIRRIASSRPARSFYVSSFSSRTIVYKGMLIPDQLRGFFPDLQDERFASAMASCTRASRRTRSRAGSSRTRSAYRPQRRDQHADGQRQLDARPRVASSRPSCSAATCRRSCRSCAPAGRTRRRSTTSSSC